MSTPSTTPSCPFCSLPLPSADMPCPHCHASADWIELSEAVKFSLHRLEQSQIQEGELQAIQEYYGRLESEMAQAVRADRPLSPDCQVPPRDRCWSCGTAVSPASAKFCASCGAPGHSPAVRSLRFLTFLCHEIKKHADGGRLGLAQAHHCMTEARQRLAALRARLEKQRVPLAVAVAETPIAKNPAPASPWRRPIWEILLDPRSIQWLLGFGGALLVIGLIIWLGTLGVFENPIVIAAILGAANATLLGGGWFTIRYTRFQTAGRALTLLACLVMPLNLWFYDRNNLVVLSQGGHLWLAALVCCVLYAASALVLRDRMFVYVLVAGVTMTGLLILADRNVNRLFEIAPAATLLVILGLASLHVERAFPNAEGPFSRRQFGMAFFWSGHALLGAGLLLLLGAQLFGWLHDLFAHTWNLQAYEVLRDRPAIVAEHPLKVLALILVLGGTYAYLYSDIVVRRVGVYVYFAVFTLLWAEVLVIDLLNVPVGMELAIAALALTALAANLLQFTLTRHKEVFARTGPPLGLFLSTLPVLLGIILHLRATNLELNKVWPYQASWGYVAAMLATAISCRIGAYLYRHSMPRLSATYFFGTAGATLVGVAGLLIVIGVGAWAVQAPVLMLIPIGYLLAARLYRGHSAEKPLVWVAYSATGVMIVSVLAAALHITARVADMVITGQNMNLLLALFWAEAAVFFGLAAAYRQYGFNVYLATAMACASVWQLLNYWEIGAEYSTVAFACLGMLLLIAYRLAVLERFKQTGIPAAAFQCANALMSLSFVAAALLTLSRLLVGQQDLARLGQGDWKHPLQLLVFVLILLGLLGLLAAGLVRQQAWRRWYVISAITEGMLTLLAMYRIVDLSPWQQLELFSVVVGLVLLVLGHVGWYREQDRQNDMVSFSLFLGSLLAGLPLGIAMVIHRYQLQFSVPDELGLLSLGVLLLGTGFMFQIRSTTLTGAGALTLYLVTLVLFAQEELKKIQTAALWLTIGGAAIFTAGLVLSIYRDRLLALPDKIKRRQGVFRVLSWR